MKFMNVTESWKFENFKAVMNRAFFKIIYIQLRKSFGIRENAFHVTRV
jgi:hypothetical protein